MDLSRCIESFLSASDKKKNRLKNMFLGKKNPSDMNFQPPP
jgi:hypothetical protein